MVLHLWRQQIRWKKYSTWLCWASEDVPCIVSERCIREAIKGMARWKLHLVLEGFSPKCNTLLDIGYIYSASKVLWFVATKNAGTTKPVVPNCVCFVDDFQNLLSGPFEHPSVILNYFQKCINDKHNQASQSELRLEKHWHYKNCLVQVNDNMIGIVVTYCWKTYNKYSYLSKKSNKEISLKNFADLLSYELINNNKVSYLEASVIENLSPLEQLQPAACADGSDTQ